jgi:uncharacterized Zn-finger protein
MKWIECGYCETEFRVVSESLDTVTFCPFCGTEIEPEEDEYEEE